MAVTPAWDGEVATETQVDSGSLLAGQPSWKGTQKGKLKPVGPAAWRVVEGESREWALVSFDLVTALFHRGGTQPLFMYYEFLC